MILTALIALVAYFVIGSLLAMAVGRAIAAGDPESHFSRQREARAEQARADEAAKKAALS